MSNQPNILPITDVSAPELEIYTHLNENQLLHYYEPHGGLFMAESPMIIERALNAGYEPISLLVEEKLLKDKLLARPEIPSAEASSAHVSDDFSPESSPASADGKSEAALHSEPEPLFHILDRCGDIPIYTADFDTLTSLTGFRFQLTRGALCAMKRKPLPSLEEVCKNARRIAILENVVNPTNVGAIFRSAAALNMDAILLTHASSDPLYRRSIRVSMATVFQIPWTILPEEEWPGDAFHKLHAMGYQTVAMALKPNSYAIDAPELMNADKLAIVLGTEGDGLASSTIADCDYTCMIPMAHGVDSLNVAAASAVAFWQLGNR